MKHLTNILLIFLSLFFSNHIQGQELDLTNLESQIDAMVPKTVNDTTPGLVVGIVQQGKLVFSKGYGLANISYGIPNNPRMVYNIGSVSKQFLGYAFAMLHVEGKLSIDDPVSNYFEDWPHFKHKVTLRHLLTHTSGYREAYTMSALAGRPIGVDHLSREECLNVVRMQPELEFIPGSRWTYNSTAWVILAEVLEVVTGQSADEWVTQNILKPLNMKDTQIESYVGEVIQNSAESYTYHPDKGYTNLESNRAIFGAAEIYTNIDDLVQWIKNYTSFHLGNKAVNELFLTPFILNDGTNSKYALGIGNSTYRGLKRYRHTGGHEAFSTQLSYFPEPDFGIITISNFGGKGWLATSKIADLLLEDFMTPNEVKEISYFNMDKQKLAQYAGRYLATTMNYTTNLTFKEDSLYIDEQSLIPTSDSTFGITGWNGYLLVSKAHDGSIQLSVVDGSIEVYTKVKEWTPDGTELQMYKGDYWSDELETVYHVGVKGENLKVNHRWIGEVILKPITKDIFETDKGYNIKFQSNEKNEIVGLEVYSGRTANVYFGLRK